MQVLCLDCEEPFRAALKQAGHRVQEGWLGYRAGSPGRRITTPPHEVEAVLYHLERPACFDMASWGPGGENDQTRCRIVEAPRDETVRSDGQAYPRYPLIFESQIRLAPDVGAMSFGPEDIFRAVKEAGVLVFILLNQAFMQHVTVAAMCWRSPNVFGASPDFARTEAGETTLHPALHARLPQFGTDELALVSPLKYAFRGALTVPTTGAFASPGEAAGSLMSCDAVSNAVGDVFSRIVTIGRGLIWYLPEFADPARAVVALLSHADTIRELGQALRASAPAPVEDTSSQLDDLLPIYRRGYLERHLQPTLETCVAQRLPFALLMVDVDHFKQVNDRYGHQTGDHVLQAVALLLKQAAGHKGMVVRYGGEELCVVLPNYGVEEAMSLAERLRAAVESYPFRGEGHGPLQVPPPPAVGLQGPALRAELPPAAAAGGGVTVSIGITSTRALLPTAVLIRQADTALQEAKRLGRNRVRIYQGER